MLEASWIAYVVLLSLLGLYGAHRLYLVAVFWRVGRAGAPRAALPDVLPVVTVQLPLYNERCVAERLIAAAAALDWPRDRLQIQILDDSTDETVALVAARVAELTARGVWIEHCHRVDRQGYKAGALRAGMATAAGELIALFDADFVPAPDFLRAVVPRFGDPGIGMVQARWEHLNRRASVLTRVQALLLDGHFAIEQHVRARTGRFFNFNGTAGVWRRQAIVDAGGWSDDTLTEDLDLSYRALLAGWRFDYLLADAAPAELPADMNAFKSQQYRWAKGAMQVARKLLPRVVRAPLPLRVKLEALFHLTQNVPYLLTFLLALLAVPALVLRPHDAVWLHVPAAVATVATLGAYAWASQRALGRGGWRALVQLPALMAVTAGMCVNQARAVVEGALGHQSPFVRTPKDGRVDDRRCVGPSRRHYRTARHATSVAEVALAALFAGGAAALATQQRWAGVPFFALLAAGFAYVAIGSLARR